MAEYFLLGFIFRISAEFGLLMVLLLLSRLRKIEERIPPRVRRDSSSRIPQWKGTTLLRCSCEFWTQVTARYTTERTAGNRFWKAHEHEAR